MLSLELQGGTKFIYLQHFGTFKFKDLLIEEETIGDIEQYKRYEIENIHFGFFMEIAINSNNSYYCIAFEFDGIQYNYEGMLCEGYEEFLNSRKDEITTEELNQIEELNKYSLRTT